MVPLRYNVRSLFVRKTTTLATAFGVALVVFVFASALMLGAGIKKTLATAGRSDAAIVLRKGADAELASSVETRFASLVLAAPGVKRDTDGKPLAAGEIVVVITLDKEGAEGMVSNIQVRGVTDNAMRLRPDVRIVEGRPAQPGTDEVIVGKGLVGRFGGVKLGQSFELRNKRPAKVVGVFDSGGSSLESEVWADVDFVRSSFGREGGVSSVTAVLESSTKYDAFSAYVENDKQLGLEAMRESEYEKMSEGTSVFVTALGVLIAVFFSLGAMIGAMITMYAAVAQRTREIGTLQALGFSRFAVLTSFLAESVILAGVGGSVGVLAALLMSQVKFSMMNFATWQEVSFSFSPEPGILLTALIGGGTMGILGGLLPAVRAARISPLAAMRD
jgi:putative ABC transport system permease protein